MFAPRTAAGLTLALLALPATATAQTTSPADSSGGGAGGALSNHYGWGESTPSPVQPNPDQRTVAPTSSLAGSTSPQDFRNPDGADAARAGDIAKAMEHYQPTTVAAKPASPDNNDVPAWPEIAFAGVVLLATAGGVVRVRMRRRQRVAA